MTEGKHSLVIDYKTLVFALLLLHKKIWLWEKKKPHKKKDILDEPHLCGVQSQATLIYGFNQKSRYWCTLARSSELE